ncbi:hypothetical protein AV521_04010 [Streptomyces sp. IMTB 2501]|nr:hypothetical protein AV521_04010 [Streptomyces sp. IMTB 2501]
MVKGDLALTAALRPALGSAGSAGWRSPHGSAVGGARRVLVGRGGRGLGGVHLLLHIRQLRGLSGGGCAGRGLRGGAVVMGAARGERHQRGGRRREEQAPGPHQLVAFPLPWALHQVLTAVRSF